MTSTDTPKFWVFSSEEKEMVEKAMAIPSIREYVNSLVAELYPLDNMPPWVNATQFYQEFFIPDIITDIIATARQGDAEHLKENLDRYIPGWYSFVPFVSTCFLVGQDYDFDVKTTMSSEVIGDIRDLLWKRS